METKRSSLLLASFVLTAAQLLAASPSASFALPLDASPPHSRPSSSPVKLRAHLHPLIKSASLRRVTLVPAGEINLATEPHFAVVTENGRTQTLSQSDGFDPDQKRTTASLTKLLTADAVIRKSGTALSPHDREFLKEGILHSNNFAITEAALDTAPGHNASSVLDMLKGLVQELGLNGQYEPRNASGYPNLPNGKRDDTKASPRALLTVALDVAATSWEGLKDIYYNVSPADGPTNNLMYPIRGMHDPEDSKVRMFGKTGTDMYQNHSMIVVVKDGPKTYAFFHPHLPSPKLVHDPLKSDPRSPVSTMAAIVLKILREKTDFKDPLVLARLNAIATGKLRATDVTDEGHVDFASQAPHLQPKPHVGRKLDTSVLLASRLGAHP